MGATMTGATATALVTGSSSGIGRAIALRLAESGSDVILHGCESIAALEELVAEITRIGRRATYLQADFRQSNGLSKFVGDAWDAFGAIDVWVNNAGADVLTGSAREGAFTEKLELLWKTDVLPTLVLSREVGKRMRERARSTGAAAGSFSIINIGWDQAAQGMAGDSGEIFGAVKGAVMAATLSLAQSLAPEVRVNCIAPGWIRTAWGQSATEAWQVRATRESLMGRWGAPDDVANLAAFLAGPQASFLSGQIIPLNGGFRFDQSAS
jgi:3-oxoacyl-[acyl-carrier protein] reductase